MTNESPKGSLEHEAVASAQVGENLANAIRSKRPYSRPRMETGDAFERVQLASGCNEGVYECDFPC
jgi:hypothetical protein